MPTAEQARDLLISAAGPRDLGAPSVKLMLARAARRLGIGLRRARAIYHREARLIGADEWESIKRHAAENSIKSEWGAADHAALAIRVREAAAPARRRADELGGAMPEPRQEGGGPGAGAAVGSQRSERSAGAVRTP